MMRASSGTAAQKAAMKAAMAAEQIKKDQAGADTSAAVVTPTTPMPTTPVATKVYYLMCSFCRWTTRDVNIPDVTTSKKSREKNLRLSD